MYNVAQELRQRLRNSTAHASSRPTPSAGSSAAPVAVVTTASPATPAASSAGASQQHPSTRNDVYATVAQAVRDTLGAYPQQPQQPQSRGRGKVRGSKSSQAIEKADYLDTLTATIRNAFRVSFETPQ